MKNFFSSNNKKKLFLDQSDNITLLRRYFLVGFVSVNILQIPIFILIVKFNITEFLIAPFSIISLIFLYFVLKLYNYNFEKRINSFRDKIEQSTHPSSFSNAFKIKVMKELEMLLTNAKLGLGKNWTDDAERIREFDDIYLGFKDLKLNQVHPGLKHLNFKRILLQEMVHQFSLNLYEQEHGTKKLKQLESEYIADALKRSI